MDFLRDLAGWSTLAVAAILLIVQLLAHEIGYRIGSSRKTSVQGQAENVGVVVAGMLGLLAFVLALTLSYSTARFSERRQGTLNEANAIGTAFLRASAIGSPQAVEVARLLEDYLKARRAFVDAGLDNDAIASANQDTSRLQQSIWRGVSAIVRDRPDPVSVSLMSAVNEAFDAGTAERFAMGIRLPSQIFWLLTGVMLLSMASLGYQFGLRGRPVRVLILLLTVVWTAVIVNILDLASPRVGNFRTNAAVYEWTRQGFSGMGLPPAESQ
ncbi:hypothetical protein FHX08_001363 [Rhizobium sp. BK529]|uniref:hypothetical protein n=1 Tax=unclassified Rhizobium TaxID=2613769 RepID=UPI00104D95A0|nr:MULTISPECIES: hypothetical protein [unclassified Rhizobium]MBB3591019.1 hypothetical protein [Rhizobium sp. BK529]TCS09028.1 hypothetical protein EV281_101909 [Rhizobium sp. BK418]